MTLTDSDYREIALLIKNDPQSNAIFKAWNCDKTLWKAAFQAAEDWFINGFNNTPQTSFKAALDAVVVTTANQAKVIGKIWFGWRVGLEW